MEKKLVLLTKYFPPEMGAPQSRLYETVLGLKKRGWDIMVITALPNYPTGKVFASHRGRFSMREEMNGIPVQRYNLYASHSKKSIPRIISMLSFGVTSMCSMFRVRKFRPAYIITESPPLTLGLTGITLARFSRAKHIMNVSDIWPLSALRLGAISEGYMYKKLEGLERYLYTHSHACMGQSAEITERLEQTGSKRTLLFRNGVDFQRFDAARKGVKKTPHDRLRIVYAGLLGIAQGILELCKQIDFDTLGAELHIYGHGAEKEEIENYIRQNPRKGIYLYPTVQRDVIPETLMRYDVTLIPLITHIYGAVPSKIYEAMAAGLPVIFAGGGEGEKIIIENNAGWACTPSDFKDMANTIAKVAQMPAEELQQISDNCVGAAKHIFDREIQIENLHRFLLKEE